MIIGNQKTIDKIKKAGPDDKWNHVNFDAIESLPEEFEAVITEVRYDPANLTASFSDVGNKTYMPKPELMYEIAEACGISGGENSINEPLIEEIDYSRILADILAPPQMLRMAVGRTVKKYSTVTSEDGTLRKSSVCTSSYNAYERCCDLWSNEEKYTDGYTKAGQYPNKYQTRWQRRSHFDNEMKFAAAKAETKAHLKTIRELAGLMTGYKAEDLKSGVLVFAKFRRSSKVLKMETAARLTALSRGNGPTQLPGGMLFGQLEAPESAPAQESPAVSAQAEVIPHALAKSQAEQMAQALTSYLDGLLTDQAIIDKANNILSWLSKVKKAEDSASWPNVKESFLAVEAAIIPEGRMQHDIK